MLRHVTLAAIVQGWPKATAALSRPPFAEAFGRVVIGQTIDDFAAEFQRPEPVVVVLQCYDSLVVLRRFFAENASRVLWIHSLYAGIDWFNFGDFAKEIQCPVTNARGVYSEMLAEHALLGTLYFNRDVARLQRQRKERIWDRFASPPASAQTVGILGYGDIGRCCASRFKGGLNVSRILGYRRTALPDGQTHDDLGVEVVPESRDGALQYVLQNSDVIVMALPNVPATANMLAEAQFEWIRAAGRRPILINVGRGVTVNEAALTNALRDGTLRGAALDVFTKEPLPVESPLWNIGDDKLLFTPHNADISTSMEMDAISHFGEIVTRYNVDRTLPRPVDLQRGY